MRGVRAVAAGLAATLAAAPAAAREPAEGPVSVGALWSENLSDYGDRRAAAGDHAGAAGFYFRAYDRLADDRMSQRLVGAMHEPLEKGADAAAEAQRRDPTRVDLLCETDARLVRHALELADAGHLTPEAIAVLRGARERVLARLYRVAAVCPPPIRQGPASLHTNYPREHDADARILEPGALARAARTVIPPLPRVEARPDRGRVFTRAGVGLMSAGLMAIGLGIALSTLDRPGSDVPTALSFVGGAGMFAAGFPLLIVGDKRRRDATLALGPRGLALSF